MTRRGAASFPSPTPDRGERDLAHAAVFAAMSEGFALCDPICDPAGRLTDYVLLEMNAALQGMLGVGPEVLGTKLTRTGPPDARWLATCNRVLQTGDPAVFEYHNRGTGRWHEIRISRVENRLSQLFIDITERKLAEAQLKDSREYLRLILDAAADAFYCVDRDGVTTHCNAAFLRILGLVDENEVISRKLHDVIHHSHPDGSPYAKSDCPIYQGAQTGEPRHVDDEVFFRADGSAFPVEYWVRPILRDGVLQGAICTFQDITERKAAQEARDLLFREMNHRIKNLFAVIDGVVALSSRSASDPKEVAAAVRGRLAAIARAHELILPSLLETGDGERRTDMASLGGAVLSPYLGAGPGSQARIEIAGPDLAIGEKAAGGFALVLHELATNALKYGALSAPDGRVRLAWSTADAALTLQWTETGGPAVGGPPDAEGFGSLLVRRSVAGHLGGRIDHDWAAEGLRVTITAPTAQLAAERG